eukprot:COSAG04_NODE_5255_length_1684_cov_2.034700_1_plen_64_part_00
MEQTAPDQTAAEDDGDLVGRPPRRLSEPEVRLLNDWYEKCVEYNNHHNTAASFFDALKTVFQG